MEGGILKGDRPASSFVFTTQGIAYNQYTFGVGTGFDFYPFRSLPLFVDVKRKFSDKKIQPFIQAAAGINFTNTRSSDAKEWYQYAGGHFNNGFFAKGGCGLLLRAQKQLKFALSAGYSYKTTSFTYAPFTGTPWAWQMQPLKDIYHYNRWYIGVGILW
ncbi:hypothetical protein FC093_09025 [Ilyomonas limi]|jgi:hypothetical protein|uniref:Outer membrane protein beta-barrel domain-containing protein n=1 Tax=Ilyomonas limi TaxID=2575867 RepID=A0A4U3L1F9_9BACT|nr:hypothetical protein [Ilyomonas limi]TKK68828.1 hypothetical protein FC093_09025 [Ilyomonas limi]